MFMLLLSSPPTGHRPSNQLPATRRQLCIASATDSSRKTSDLKAAALEPQIMAAGTVFLGCSWTCFDVKLHGSGRVVAVEGR
ncbi:hypothetical protein TgHK011_005636 [Trichoderma gracile]|nr:hypothetical protein TgHK011_005636 [Trichoderma gracile]